MEVARRLVWRCLVDDPVLFFRTILEQLTKKDKQVSWFVSPSLRRLRRASTHRLQGSL